jgi:Zn-dependent protease
MLRFQIASIPVEVRPTHLLIAGYLAWISMPGMRAPEVATAVLALLGGMFVVFVSILVHELGHAAVARAYGYRPAIVIEWFGGHTTPNAPGPIPWLKDVLLTLAGPMFGLGLGVVALVGFLAVGGEWTSWGSQTMPLFHQVLLFFAAANFLWALLNLMPVLPLDGGRISHAVLTRLFGRHGVLFSQGLALLICAGLVALGARSGMILMAVFFGLWGFQALKLLAAYFKGEDRSAPPHPADLAFAQAATLFQGDKLADARRVAEQALAGAAPRETESRLRHLLGWVAVKEGRGEDALDQFGQVKTHAVESQALAAAHSLAGDDERALSLWELAYRDTRDPTLLHEWAGCLIRLGRVEEARRLPDADPVESYRAAEAVLLQRGEFEAAGRLGEQAVAEVPRPELAYNAACAFARAGQVSRAQQLLERAAELGFRDASYAQADADLAAVRQGSWFEGWLERTRVSARR